MRSAILLGVLTLPASLFPLPALCAQKRAITVDDYLALKNVGDAQVSPDGKWVVYTVGTVSLQDNKSTSRLWLASVPLGVTKELLQGAGSDRSPRWSPDGQTIAFLSGREHGPQVWVVPAAGGTARRVSDLPDGVGEMYWMPDGKGFLVVSDIKWPKEQEIDRRNGPYPTDARLWTSVFYRHWVDWRAGMRQHVFSVDLATGTARDLTPIDKDAPTIATSGDGDVAMSPDGKEIAVAIHADSIVADNTNVDVYLMNPDGSGLKNLTAANAGADNTPRFSPD
ncbi:MAG TPA: hypothetical protein VH163_00650, partial [Gemmatimonadales bacterium]|nr:hypothetical protein [Gemmatimonadales bacterium]